MLGTTASTDRGGRCGLRQEALQEPGGNHQVGCFSILVILGQRIDSVVSRNHDGGCQLTAHVHGRNSLGTSSKLNAIQHEVFHGFVVEQCARAPPEVKGTRSAAPR